MAVTLQLKMAKIFYCTEFSSDCEENSVYFSLILSKYLSRSPIFMCWMDMEVHEPTVVTHIYMMVQEDIVGKPFSSDFYGCLVVYFQVGIQFFCKY